MRRLPRHPATEIFWIPEGECWLGVHMSEPPRSDIELEDRRYLGPFRVRRDPPPEGNVRSSRAVSSWSE